MTAAALGPRPSSARVRPMRGLTWVTWRQHRLALAGVLAVLGGLGLFMLFNGLAMHHAYTRLGLHTCGRLDGPSCHSQLAIFQQDYMGVADHLPQLLLILPGLIGIFTGAPLVAREFESGTFRFAWTQGRSRVQWIVTKLTLLAVVLTALALAFSALATWWYGPFDAISGRMTANGAYEISGLVFAARTLFGFTLGALLGLLIRRTVPAMAATAATWAAVVIPSMLYLRPLIRTPITTLGHPGKGAIASSHVPFNANVIHNWIQNGTGQHVDNDQLFQQAIVSNHGTIPSPDQFEAWMSQHHYSQWVSYQSNSWFWHFQTIEAAGYGMLAVLLAITTVVILRRRAV
jgi:ABC-type transport system involved in multi-copper enzyme maturation permease subunit